MAERRVAMAVFMRFGEMKVEPDRHQQPGEDELPGDVLANHSLLPQLLVALHDRRQIIPRGLTS